MSKLVSFSIAAALCGWIYIESSPNIPATNVQSTPSERDQDYAAFRSLGASDADAINAAYRLELARKNPCIFGINPACVERGSNDDFCREDALRRYNQSFNPDYNTREKDGSYIEAMKRDCLSDPARYRRLRTMLMQQGD